MLITRGGRRIAVRGELQHTLSPPSVRFTSQGLQRLWDDQCEARENAENFMPVPAPVEASNFVVLHRHTVQFGFDDRLEVYGYRETEHPRLFTPIRLEFSQVKPRGYASATMVPAAGG
jgi:hypothetical protein